GVDADVKLLRLAAEGDDVDDTRDLFELPLEDPILDGLEIPKAKALTLELVAKDFADRVPRADDRVYALRQLDHVEAIEDLLSCLLIRCAPTEVALDVG